jgi:hypothetical protein
MREGCYQTIGREIPSIVAIDFTGIHPHRPPGRLRRDGRPIRTLAERLTEDLALEEARARRQATRKLIQKRARLMRTARRAIERAFRRVAQRRARELKRHKPCEPTADEIATACIECQLRKPRVPLPILTSLEQLLLAIRHDR